MKEILLTQGKIAVIDDEDYIKVNKYKWRYQPTSSKGKGYAARESWDRETKKRKTQYMHHFIFGQITELDHMDGDGLNNQKNNLRVASHSENLINRGAQKNNKSGYKGVSFISIGKRKKRWRAVIGVKGRYIGIGNYKTKEEAALAYNEAAINYFGEFAYLNNIIGGSR